MAEAPPPTTAHIIGASIPRSGHHYIVRLLEAVLGDRFFYCWAYGVMGCCRAVPCAFWGRRQVSFQKSHDLDLTLPTDVEGATYLIQHRTPVPSALSGREFYARSEYEETYGHPIAGDRGEYAVWLGRLAAYYVGFTERWLLEPPARSLVVDYDDLSARPGEVVRRVLDGIGVDVADAVIDDAVAQIVGRGGPFGEQRYVARSLESRPYFDRELLAVYESLIVDRLPHLAERRAFPRVEYDGTLVADIFKARWLWHDGDAQEALATVDRALVDHRDNGLLLHERSVYLQVLGQRDEAQATLQAAAALPPPHPAILTTLMTVSLELDDVATGRAAAQALVRLMGPERAGPVAAGLADVEGPAQGMSAGQERTGGLDTEADRLRFLRGEVAAREVAVRRAELVRIEKDRVIAEKDRVIEELAAAADERLGLIQQLDATAAEVRDKELVIAELAATADERLGLLQQLDDTAAEIREKERIIAELAAAADERLKLVEILDAAAAERLGLIQQLNATATELREALELAHQELQQRDAAQPVSSD